MSDDVAVEPYTAGAFVSELKQALPGYEWKLIRSTRTGMIAIGTMTNHDGKCWSTARVRRAPGGVFTMLVWNGRIFGREVFRAEESASVGRVVDALCATLERQSTKYKRALDSVVHATPEGQAAAKKTVEQRAGISTIELTVDQVEEFTRKWGESTFEEAATTVTPQWIMKPCVMGLERWELLPTKYVVRTYTTRGGTHMPCVVHDGVILDVEIAHLDAGKRWVEDKLGITRDPNRECAQ